MTDDSHAVAYMWDEIFRKIPKEINYAGERMPIDVMPANEILSKEYKNYRSRLEKLHAIHPGKMFKREPKGEKWTKEILSKIILARLEGASFSDIAFHLSHPVDLNGNDMPTVFDVIRTNVIDQLKYYCTDSIFKKMQKRSLVYQRSSYLMRLFPPKRLDAILKALSIERGELFVSSDPTFDMRNKEMRVAGLLRALELRMQGLTFENVAERLAAQGIESFLDRDPKKSAHNLEMMFERNFSEKTLKALDTYREARYKRTGGARDIVSPPLAPANTKE